jgi:hypothetical protein
MFYVVCLKSSVNGTRKQTKHKMQTRGRQIRGVRWVDFFLFPRLKSIIKGAHCADMTAIQEGVTAVLWSIPKEAFADSFQQLYERCQQGVVKDGDYFEGQ